MGRVVKQLERHFRKDEMHSAQKEEGRAEHLGKKPPQQPRAREPAEGRCLAPAPATRRPRQRLARGAA
jgi:hypothetical protein